MLQTRDEIGVGPERQAGERLGEVTRTYFASSTRTVNGLGEALCLVGHDTCLLSRISPLFYSTRPYRATPPARGSVLIVMTFWSHPLNPPLQPGKSIHPTDNLVGFVLNVILRNEVTKESLPL